MMNQLYNIFLENISCWFRSKPNVTKISNCEETCLQQHISLYNNKYCGYCYNILDNITQLKKAKIRKKTYQFCSENCYEDWLNSPSNMI